MNIAICGLGAIGSRVALELARIAQPDYVLIDDDRVKAKNIANQGYLVRHVRFMKTAALAYMIFEISPSSRVAMIEKRLTSLNARKFLSGADLVVECFDNAESKMAVSMCSLVEMIPCLHVGMNVGYGGIKWDNGNYTISDDDNAPDICTSDLNPGMAQFVAAATVSVIANYLQNNIATNLSIAISNFHVIAS